MTSRPRRHRLLAGVTRSRLLDVLQASGGPIGIAELAEHVGLHPNSVREQLARLVDAGLVEREVAPPAGRGRPGLRYRARPETDGSEPYRALAGVLADQLARTPDPTAASLAAGERWGRSLVGDPERALTDDEAVGRIVALLDEAGFAPESPARPSDPIRLRRCPFDPLARTEPSVVCGVHLGLMRGALAELEAPLDAIALEPFVEPDLCLAHLGVRADG
jgi:predicted ArsR family transcriptional regulator